ncbi:MAG: PD-(D/E)XK nuclease family protein [Solirubrobacteraceae bacterium]
MPLTLVTGPANSAKAQVVLDRYCAVLSRSPILVVPRSADAEHYRRELAERGVVFGARVEPFAVLLREIAARAGLVARPLGEHARDAVLRAVVAGAGLDALARGSQAPGFAHSLGRFIAELESRRITPPRFTAALRAWASAGTSRRAYAEELAGLYAGYRRRLERLGRLDAELHTLAALDALALAGERWRQVPVFCYGFDDLDPLQLDAIETLAHKVGAPVTLSLPGEPGRLALAGRAATLETLRPTAQEVIELDAQAEYYEEPALFHLERTLFEHGTARPAGVAVRLLEGGDERAEAELVAAEVAALIAEGFAPGEIAVVTRATGSFTELLAEALAALGVASSSAHRARLGSSSVGRGLLALLRCALAEGDAVDLVSWLGVPGVVGLEHALEAFEARLRREAISELAPAVAIWQREHGRLEGLDRLAGAARRDQQGFLDCVARELDALFAARWQRSAALIPAWEAAALLAARRALAELGELARGPGGLPGGPSEVLRTLEQVTVELAAADGETVLISDALSIRARRVRALFICAVLDGTFPAAMAAERLLGSAERTELAQVSGILLGEQQDGLAAERYLFYALCSRPTARLRISWHSAGDDGETALASLFVDDLRDAFEADLYRERRVRAAGAISWEGAGPVAPAVLRRELALRKPRRLGAVIGALDGGERLAALRGHAAHSPSALEKWAGCPVAWLVDRALRARDLAPENVWMARGSRAHRVLASVFTQLRERVPDGRLEQSTLPAALELLDQALAAESQPLSERAGVDRSEQRRLRLDLGRYLEFAAQRPSTHTFWQAEFAFGMAEDPHPGAELAGGSLSLCGRIDRIDLDQDAGTAIVYDYKTSSRVSAAGSWEKDRRFQQALYMRAAEQLLAVEAVGGLYQPLRRDLRPRGAIRDDADRRAAFFDADRLEREALQELIDRLVRAAAEAAQEIDRGALEPRPTTCSHEGRCMFPTICRCEAR